MISPESPESGSNIEPNLPPEPQITITPTLSAEELTEMMCKMYDAKADSLYVILSPDLKKHLQAPGLNRPYVCRNQKQAQKIADEVGGVVLTIKDAMKHMFAQIIKRNQHRK